MEDLIRAILDKIFTSSDIKYQCDLDGTIIKRPDGKQWEIKFDYKKHKLYLKKIETKKLKQKN